MAYKKKRSAQISPLAYKIAKTAKQLGSVYKMGKAGYYAGQKIYNIGKTGARVYKNLEQGFRAVTGTRGRKLIQNGRAGAHLGTMAKKKGTVILNKKLKGKTAGLWKYSQSSETLINCDAGIQRPTVINILASKANLFTSTGATYGIGQNYTALNELNPYLKISGSSLLTAGTKPATDKFALKSVRAHMEITNTSATGCTVSVHWYLSKKAHTANCVDVWDTALDDANPTAMVRTTYPVPASTAATAGIPTILIPGQRPMSNRSFRSGFKKVWSSDFQMAASAVENINVNFIYNKLIDQGKMEANAATNLTHLAGVTLSCVVIHRGQVIVDTTNEANRATYGSGQLAIVMHNEYTMCGVYGNAGRLDTSYTAVDIPYNTLISNQAYMNEAGDQEVNELIV